MEFRILGSMEVLDRARPVPLPAGRARALLALLVLHAGEVVPAERLIDELWGEHPPPTAGTMVQGFVSRLRKALEPGRRSGAAATLQTAPTGYRLAIPADDVDANRFKRLVDQSREAAPATRSALLAEALGAWRGPALADFTYEPFAQRAITTLEELRLAAIEDRVDADLALGRHGELVAELEALVAAHPFRERLRGHLMLALYRAGRQADALASYQAARTALVDELGVEPGPGLRDLQQAILQHDRSLDPQRDSAPRPGAEAVPSAEHWLPRERRTVTVLFAELATAGEPGADPEALRRVEARALDAAIGVLRRHGARVEEMLGGMLAGFFGLPVAHEDDPVRAVRAAGELLEAVDALGHQHPGIGFVVSAGIETGETVLGIGNSARAGASGEVIAVAMRLARAAAEGEVLVGPAAQRLTAGAAVTEPVRDAQGALSAWRILKVVPGALAIGRSLEAPMFGRAAELTRLRTAFSATRRRGTPFRLAVLGDPGIGKTRLVRAFVDSIGPEATVITGRCPAYGDGITFLPVREALLDAAGPRGWAALEELLGEEEGGAQIAEQVAGAIGLSGIPPRPDRLFPAIRRVLEILAARRPLVVVIEDLHWAEPTLLDLIEYLTEHATGAVFLLCLARPELIEQRPAWERPASRADTVPLDPLSEDDVRLLIQDRARATLRADVVARIVATARGNPLFAEQLLAALHDDQLGAIPASLQGLLAMRLDRLGPGERDLLRCASVVGADFPEDALVALLPQEAGSFLGRHLDVLQRMRFVEQTGGTAFRFGHALIRLAAYQSMARADRARLHERFATWLETEATEPPPELDEIAGYHLEQAVEQRRAIGPADRTMQALSLRAGERLMKAGERAYALFDIGAAENLLERARSLLPAAHPGRHRVTQLLGETYQVLGRHGKADDLLAELADVARASGDRGTQQSVALERARIRIYTSRDPVPLDEIQQVAERAARSSADAGDQGEAAKAYFVLGYARWRQGHVSAMEEAMRRSLDHATRSGQMREQLAARWILLRAILLGPAPVRTCIARGEELVMLNGSEHPGVMSDLAIATAMAGRFDESRALHERARTICIERMRVRRPLMFIAHASGIVEMLAGDSAAAEPHLRAALDLSIDMEEWDDAAQVAARLSTAMRALGRLGEASRAAAQSCEIAPADGVEAQAMSRAVTARAFAEVGEHARAQRLARDAVELVPEDMLSLRADMLVELGEVARIGGRADAATTAFREAAALYERKGNVAARRLPWVRAHAT